MARVAVPERFRVRRALLAARTRHQSRSSDQNASRNGTVDGWLRLLPAFDVDGPRVRLGLAWAAVAFVAVAAGPVVLSVVMAAVALGAAGQTCRTWRSARRRPYRPVAVGGAVVCALAGSAGPVAVVAAAVLTGVAAVAAAQLRLGRRSWDPTVTAAIALLIGVGAASPAIVRGDEGALPALVFLTVVLAVEAATFVVGSGASSRWEGPVAGVATALSLSLAVAAVFVPPFRGASPWILGLVVAAGVPLGAMAGTALLGRDEAPVPALRRLDALLVVGPVWAVVARLVLDL